MVCERTTRKRASRTLLVVLVFVGLFLAHRLQQQQENAQAAAERAMFWQNIVQHTKEAIVVVDRDGLIRHFNPAAERLFGREEEDVVGGNCAWMMDAAKWDMHRATLEQAFQRGDETTTNLVRCYAIGADNEPIYVEIRSRIVKSGRWYAVAQILPSRDIHVRQLEPPRPAEAGDTFYRQQPRREP